LKRFLRKNGHYATDDELVAILRRFDTNEDSKISYNEFIDGLRETVDGSIQSPLEESFIASSPLKTSGLSLLPQRGGVERSYQHPSYVPLPRRDYSPLQRTFPPREPAYPERLSPSRYQIEQMERRSPSRTLVYHAHSLIQLNESPLRLKEENEFRRSSPIRGRASPLRYDSGERKRQSPIRTSNDFSP
jgi:hypothetical protein